MSSVPGNWSSAAIRKLLPMSSLGDRMWGGMMEKARAYPPKQGGAVVEDTVCGFEIIVHQPANMDELEKRVAQAHANAIIDKMKKLNCSAQQKKELIDAICT